MPGEPSLDAGAAGEVWEALGYWMGELDTLAIATVDAKAVRVEVDSFERLRPWASNDFITILR